MAWIRAFWSYFEEHPALVGGGVALSFLLSVGGIIAVPLFVLSLPSDYFLPDYRQSHPMPLLSGRMAWLVLKNGIGVLLILLGIVMLVAPGPGIISMLAGLSIMSFPGKRQLELRLIRHPTVLGQIQKMRQKAGRAPLQMPS